MDFNIENGLRAVWNYVCCFAQSLSAHFLLYLYLYLYLALKKDLQTVKWIIESN